jgi:hypothetical protein
LIQFAIDRDYNVGYTNRDIIGENTMSQVQKKSVINTTIRGQQGWTIVRYHETDVVKFNNDVIILNSGKHKSATTKRRMNQTSNQFNLGFVVYQAAGKWYINCNGNTVDFQDSIAIERNSI